MKTTLFPSLLRLILGASLCAGVSVQGQSKQEAGAVKGTPQDTVFYAGGTGAVEFATVFGLSDGSVLIGGGAADLGWIPAGVPKQELTGEIPTGDPALMIPFLLHCPADLKSIKRVYTLPRGSMESVSSIRSTNEPGKRTGGLYLAGHRGGSKDGDKPGFLLARLDGNIVDTPLTRLLWSKPIGLTVREFAWDVGPDGRVLFVTGVPHGWDWYEVAAIDRDGRPLVIPRWRGHWLDHVGGTYHWGTADTATGKVVSSSILFKEMRNTGSFRSWNKEDFLLTTSDGNGGMKIGKWPFDAMYDGYFDPATKKTAKVLETEKGRGYYGYRFGDQACEINAVAIDRRTGEFYLGGNNKSRLPDGNPDFEPWVVAMAADGDLRWWQRLYPESKGVSTPDQYVDAIAIDYSPACTGVVVVAARCHGNNVNNYFRPSELVHPASPKRGFQDGFTGTKGNMHYRWIGRLARDGELVACTYLAEYAEQPASKHGRNRFADPLLSQWPDWRSGWPDLNTTGLAKDSLRLDAEGNLYLCGMGRRPVTTRNAFMENPSPLEFPNAKGQWANFVRAYKSDLTGVRYSSILRGPWDWSTGEGGSDVDLISCLPVPGGILVVGVAPLSKDGRVTGADMPTRNTPDWGRTNRLNRAGVAAVLHIP